MVSYKFAGHIINSNGIIVVHTSFITKTGCVLVYFIHASNEVSELLLPYFYYFHPVMFVDNYEFNDDPASMKKYFNTSPINCK